MKKVIGLVIFAVVLFGLYRGGSFLYQNFRGAGPSLFPPSDGFTPNQEAPSATGELARGEPVNTTGFPLTKPDDIGISIFAKDLSAPRVLAWDPNGTLVVSIPSQGKVVALLDKNNDGIADQAIDVVTGLNLPHGVAFFEFKLYIAETDQVAVYEYDLNTHKARNKKKLVDLPAGGNHFSRTIGIGPDGKLYISVGSSCNVCNEKDWRRAKILVSNLDGAGLREYATGLRNSVFFVWHPQTREMWATDMGRDLLGDNVPREEVNIVRDGGFYGWPLCYENKIHDRNFDSSDTASQACQSSIPPHIMFQAHSAPLGLTFIPTTWPQEYRGDLLVAYHGSWNRTTPTGYKVARFNLDSNGNSTGETDFLSGWLQGSSAVGRPVDLLFDTNGVLFVTDDKAGVVYRVITSQK